MESRFNKVLGSIGLSIFTVVLFTSGVLMGLCHEWPRMGLGFFLAAYMVECSVVILLNMRIDTCFTRLEELISSKSDSVRLRYPVNVVTIFPVVIAPLLLLLAMLSVNRQYWLMMCVFLSACAITVFISSGVLIALRINAYSTRLEALIARSKDGRKSKEQSEQQ